MKLTKEQIKTRECIIKFKIWFGSDYIDEVLKDYDYYTDEDNIYFYVYRRENEN